MVNTNDEIDICISTKPQGSAAVRFEGEMAMQTLGINFHNSGFTDTEETD